MTAWRRLRRRRRALPLGLGRLLALTLFTASVTGIGIYQVSAQHDLIAVAYALDEARFDHRLATEEHKRLALTLSTYNDPVKVRAIATADLGMRAPEGRDMLRIPGPEEEVQKVEEAEAVEAVEAPDQLEQFDPVDSVDSVDPARSDGAGVLQAPVDAAAEAAVEEVAPPRVASPRSDRRRALLPPREALVGETPGEVAPAAPAAEDDR